MNVTESLLQKIVPFVIRRALGPLLDEEQKHNLNVGLPGNGRIVFRDIEFSPRELTKRVQAASAGTAAAICVSRARVKSLTVQISLFASSRSSNGEGAPLLLVDLDGLLVEIAPVGSSVNQPSKSDGDESSACEEGKIPTTGSCPGDSTLQKNIQQLNEESCGENNFDADINQSRISKWIQNAIACMQCRASHVEIKVLDASLNSAITLDIESVSYSPDNNEASCDNGNCSVQPAVTSKTLSVSGLSMSCLHGDMTRGRTKILQSIGQCQIKSRMEYAISGKCTYTDVEIFVENLDFEIGAISLKCLRQVMSDMCEGASASKVHADDTESELGNRSRHGQLESAENSNGFTNAYQQPANGGILVEGSADDILYLEAFYDATDQSMSKYMSFVAPSRDSSDLTIKLHLLEMSVKCCLENESNLADAATTSAEKNCHVLDEYLLIMISDVNASATITAIRTTAHCEISYFGIEASLIEDGRIIVYPIVRFTEGEDCSDFVVTPAHISLSLQTKKRSRRNDKEQEHVNTAVDVNMQHLELFYRKNVLFRIQEAFGNSGATSSPSKQNEPTRKTDKEVNSNMSVTCSCPEMTLLFPFSENSVAAMARKNLLLRKGVATALLSSSIGVSLESIFTELKGNVRNDFRISCQSGSFFIVTRNSKRLNLAAFSSEPEVQSKSEVVLQHLPASCATSAFPIIPPLRKVCEGDSSNSTIRAKDPQSDMIKEMLRCQSTIQLHMPSCAVDMTLQERQYIQSVLADTFGSATNPVDEDENDTKEIESEQMSAIALSCDQFVMILHEGDTCSVGEASTSFVFVSDGFQLHSVLSSLAGMSQMRVVSRDVTLYEGELKPVDNCPFPHKLHKHCRQLKMRGIESLEKTAPVFYRTKLSTPVCPGKPSFQFDVINSVEGDRSVYVSFHDITYRYQLESNWFYRFIAVLQGYRCPRPGENMDTDNKNESEEQMSASVDEPLTKLFLLASDSAVDYTTPVKHSQARFVFHIGEAHISSNMISNAPFLSFKISVSDISGYLINQRYLHTWENQRLSCGSIILNVADMHASSKFHDIRQGTSLRDTLVSMGFVNATTLDTVTCFAKMNRSNPSNQSPRIHLTLSVGLLSINTCRDSFQCLTATIGEWWTEFSAPTEHELEKLRAAEAAKEFINAAKSANDQSQTENANDAEVGILDSIDNDMFSRKINEKAKVGTAVEHVRPFDQVPDSELSATELRQKHSIEADDVASNLAKSLLIQNYYTVDTTAGSNNVDMGRKSDVTEVPLSEFLLGGHDWTKIEHSWFFNDFNSDDEEQRAMWFPTLEKNGDPLSKKRSPLHIFPTHIPISSNLCDPLAMGDMNAASHAGTIESPAVNVQVIIREMSACLRFFDGYDWTSADLVGGDQTQSASPVHSGSKSKSSSRKDELLGALLNDNYLTSAEETYAPLLKDDFCVVSRPKHVRHSDRYFEIAIDGLKLRMDSFLDSDDHHLTSCLDLKVMNLFFSETISRPYVKKLLGEWVNDYEHPRDANDGVVMMKMVSMQPTTRISVDGKLMSDESKVTLQLLPLRVNLDQHALVFIRGFFAGDASDHNESGNTDEPVGTFFQEFNVKPCKLKVNYSPIGVDYNALRTGSYLELLNLFPLEDMELLLKSLSIGGVTGWGAVINEMLRYWVEDISSTQIHKFVTGAAPFNTISNIGNGVANLVLLPVDQYKRERKIGRGVRNGASSFANTVALEALNTTSKISKHVARALDTPNHLPTRPGIPRNIREASSHSYDSFSRGVQLATHTIVAVPCREYKANGATGAVRGVVRAIPVAVMAPLSGATEALSYTLLGARNQMRPDLYKEEEVMQRREGLYR